MSLVSEVAVSMMKSYFLQMELVLAAAHRVETDTAVGNPLTDSSFPLLEDVIEELIFQMKDVVHIEMFDANLTHAEGEFCFIVTAACLQRCSLQSSQLFLSVYLITQIYSSQFCKGWRNGLFLPKFNLANAAKMILRNVVKRQKVKSFSFAHGDSQLYKK